MSNNRHPNQLPGAVPPERLPIPDWSAPPSPIHGVTAPSIGAPLSPQAYTVPVPAPLMARPATPTVPMAQASRGGERLASLLAATPIDVSILLGTVGRPKMLRDCIAAVRRSFVGAQLKYEIVVAYGAEDEAALPWMRAQPDIVPILGGMTGAIDAFNRAYECSRGRLICQINDDVIVDGVSILTAVQFLQANSGAAGVIFKFDRGDGQGYRNIPTPYPHPNQMVTRRETCEAVIEHIGAFWGDKAHRTHPTYGGDTAFGVLCNYLGLRLVTVDGVTCRDLEVKDALRERNAVNYTWENHGAAWHQMYAPYMPK